MTTATGYITYRVDFSFDESKIDKEQALQEILDNALLSTESVQVDYKEVGTTVL